VGVVAAGIGTTVAVAVAAQEPTRSLSEIPDGTLQTPYRVERVASDLRVPWDLTFLRDGRILFTEREGRVRIIEHGDLVGEPALSIKVAQGNKMGMLGLAQDPHFERNHFIYIAYDYEVTVPPEDPDPPYRLRVVRYRLQGNTLVEPQTLIEDIPAATNHTGSRLVFGPRDGKLYVTTGDADRPPNAQRLDRLNGKILRLNSDGSIPSDNPFVKTEGARAEIWSYGHRNPQGLVFEPHTGLLLDTEHGPFGGDEINWIEKGHNYGWPVIDHARTQSGMEAPIFEFSPSVAPGEALFYRGNAFPELKNQLLVACLRGEGVLRIGQTHGQLGTVQRLFRQQFGRIRSLTESPEGYLYLTTSQFDPVEGKPRPTYDLILRIVPANVAPSHYAVFTPAATPPDTAVAEEKQSILDMLGSKERCGACHASPKARDNASTTLTIIDRNCAACHGVALLGGSTAPRLIDTHWKYATDDASLKRIISTGISERGMPGNSRLKPEEMTTLVHYLRTLNSQTSSK